MVLFYLIDKANVVPKHLNNIFVGEAVGGKSCTVPLFIEIFVKSLLSACFQVKSSGCVFTLWGF